MAHTIEFVEDDFVKVFVSGVMDEEAMDAFEADILEILSRHSADYPLRMMLDSHRRESHLPISVRKKMIALMSDDRFGKIAFMNPNSTARVLVRFVFKAMGRANIKFCADIEESMSWVETPE